MPHYPNRKAMIAMIAMDGKRLRKLLFPLLLLVLVILGLTAFVVLPIAPGLVYARRILSSPPQDVTIAELRRARAALVRASSELDSLPADVLGVVPVLGENLEAVQVTAAALVPVVDASLELRRTVDSALARGLIRDGQVDLRAVRALREPLLQEVRTLTLLEQRLSQSRNGWLVPPLWSILDGILERTTALRSSAEGASRVVALAPKLLGAREPRHYLIVVLNNTELRGAGGIVSGAGVLSVKDGRLRLGDFSYYQDLRGSAPFDRVPAPQDFREHFGIFRADTTRWVTASSSPDVPDVAEVVRHLYDLATGISADGVVVADPRGLAALLLPSTSLSVPERGIRLQARSIPRFVYSVAYRKLGGGTRVRRDSLVDIGEAAFDQIIDGGVARRAAVGGAAAAFNAQHLRFVSFRSGEQQALVKAGLTGEVGTPEGDGSFVTVQNLGGNKLDLYADRTVKHACEIRKDGAECETSVTIENHTPDGLTPFQYQYEPYGLFKNFAEIYVPQAADLKSVTVGNRPARFSDFAEDGYRAIGTYLEIARHDSAVMEVSYDLPVTGSRYALTIRPQPLTKDARLTVRLLAPGGWRLLGPDGSTVGDGALVFRGPLRGSLAFEAQPDPRTGLPRIWEGFSRFLREPVF
jgi:hypothetical protein